MTHALSTFGLVKQTLKRIINRGDIANEEYADACEKLLARRGEQYTLDEIAYLNDLTYRAHHDCVLDNPDDYSRLEVHNTKMRVYQHALRENKIALYRLIEEVRAAGHTMNTWSPVRLPMRGFQPSFWGGMSLSSIKHDKHGMMIYQATCTKCSAIINTEEKEFLPCTHLDSTATHSL
jgi:hypothetical protein